MRQLEGLAIGACDFPGAWLLVLRVVRILSSGHEQSAKGEAVGRKQFLFQRGVGAPTAVEHGRPGWFLNLVEQRQHMKK